ncbi:MAG: nitronate monooxygenase [marine bacterium B5-7]|nr:MAG: nitronate monooxygenase [marine bacterium B5-7]
MKNNPGHFLSTLRLRDPAIIQAPMAGGVTTPELVAAVSNAGGLGSFATGYLSAEQIISGIAAIKKLTERPFAVNVFIPNRPMIDKVAIEQYQLALNHFRQQLSLPEETAPLLPALPQDNLAEIVDILLTEKIPVVSFTFGLLPKAMVRKFKAQGTYLVGTANTIADAKALMDLGVDAIVAQGVDAGGHQGGFSEMNENHRKKTMALLTEIVAISTIPVIASGAIMTGEDILIAKQFGAAAVQMGTAFLTTQESGANPFYKTALREAKNKKGEQTVLTKAYSGKWARGLYTDFVKYIENEVDVIPDYPITNALSAPIRKSAAKQGKTALMSLWCGTGISKITSNITVAQLLNQLYEQYKELL